MLDRLPIAPAVDVSPGQTTTFDVPIIPLPPASYDVRLSIWGPDGRSFAYGYNLGSSDFYVVTGVR